MGDGLCSPQSWACIISYLDHISERTRMNNTCCSSAGLTKKQGTLLRDINLCVHHLTTETTYSSGNLPGLKWPCGREWECEPVLSVIFFLPLVLLSLSFQHSGEQWKVDWKGEAFRTWLYLFAAAALCSHGGDWNSVQWCCSRVNREKMSLKIVTVTVKSSSNGRLGGDVYNKLIIVVYLCCTLQHG